MAILAVSDVHLGCSDSDAKSFRAFLSGVTKRKDVEHFVIVGDFVDMWRRDVSGLFLENYDIVQSLEEIASKDAPVHYVVGNHDIHLQKLKDHHYPFKFELQLPLQVDDAKLIFKHGYDFEKAQVPEICELLCHNLSDEAGKVRSEFWKWITSKPDISKKIDEAIQAMPVITTKAEFGEDSNKTAYLDYLMAAPSKRIPDKEVTEEKMVAGAKMSLPFGSVETRAASEVHDGEILIFGHTHRPFVNNDGRLANTGSWMISKGIYNTYIEINGKDIHLIQFDGAKGKDITKQNLRNYKVKKSIISH